MSRNLWAMAIVLLLVGCKEKVTVMTPSDCDDWRRITYVHVWETLGKTDTNVDRLICVLSEQRVTPAKARGETPKDSTDG